jgi:ferric-dicitrate binding protein FerR (iron transport regulator)
MQATILEPVFRVSSNIESAIVTGWTKGQFVFDNTPLKDVIAEVERQYNINVIPASYPNHLYSGNFSKTDDPAKLLEAIGKPFGIMFSIDK